MEKYDPSKIEPKWQAIWAKNPEFCTAKDDSKLEKAYILDMFPYPSGDGLHVGHVESYTATDIYSRYLRMKGKNVLHPQGFDAFGLPAENYAIKTGIHPKETTKKAIETFKRQINSMGFSYDWSREVISSDPEYYKWTQWFFLMLYKNGLAYRKKAKVNWCPRCQTVLANEQAESGKCERCETEVIQKDLEQWFFKITDFIEDNGKTSGLLSGLEKVDWPESTKAAQKNWIGRSEGVQFKMQIEGTKEKIEVYTTRIDTVFGMTYAVVAPEHEIIQTLKDKIENWQEVEKYLGKSKKKTDLDRMEAKEKTGVELKGIKIINPFNNEALPLFVADYVLGHYGTGAVMAVPAHDERDFEFAKKYNLPIKRVIEPKFINDPSSPSAAKPNEDFIKRNAVAVIVRNPKDDKYLCINWKKDVFMHGIVTGGIKEGEDVVEAARREVLEETGYRNLKLVKVSDVAIHCFFYHLIKKHNRWARFQYVIFDLENEDRDPVSDEESSLHEVLWKNKEEFSEFFSVREGKFITNLIEDTDYIFTDDGILYNSGEFSELDSKEAREKITKWLEDNNLGQKKINYKLRDWLVSRQRYWGAPIPIIYCDECAKKKPRFIFFHSYKGSSKGDFWPWLKLELENKGFEVFAPDLPGSNEPKIEEQIKFVLDNYNIDENTVIVTHSLGGVLAMKLLSLDKIKARKLIMMAPPLNTDFKDKNPRPALKNYCDWKFNFEKIRKNAKEVIVLADLNDYIVPAEHTDEISKELGATLVKSVAPSSHFDCDKADIILNNVLTPDVLNYGEIPVPEKDLPVMLPDDVDFKPTGESPLKYSKKFQDVKCPKCGGKARRESDTMDTFVCSSWYYLRYADPKNKKEFASKKLLQKWLPVDLYVGGAEHTVLHLLYSRFFTKALHKLGYLEFDEPFLKLRHQGIILAENGAKMSKSKGNVVNPDEVVKQYGADALRMFEMFMGPLEDMKPWNTKGIIGILRFLERTWKLQLKVENIENKQSSQISNSPNYLISNKIANSKSNVLINKTIKKVSEDIEALKFNTAISALMILANELEKKESITITDYQLLVILLSPFAPHLAEEIWQEKLGHKESIFTEEWPEYDPKLIKDAEIELVIQINGKVRDKIMISADILENEAKEKATASEKIKNHISGKEVKKVIYVKGRLINIVL